MIAPNKFLLPPIRYALRTVQFRTDKSVRTVGTITLWVRSVQVQLIPVQIADLTPLTCAFSSLGGSPKKVAFGFDRETQDMVGKKYANQITVMIGDPPQTR
jgi:hypothetical protein